MDSRIRSLMREVERSIGIPMLLLSIHKNHNESWNETLGFLETRSNRYWQSLSGANRPISMLKDDHLLNILRCKLVRDGYTLTGHRTKISESLLKLLKLEAKYRGLSLLGPMTCKCGHDETKHRTNPKPPDRYYTGCNDCKCKKFRVPE